MTSLFLKRTRIVSGVCVVFGLILLSRLYFLQIVHGDSFVLKADRQYEPRSGALWDRGSIFFSDKKGNKVSAATLQSGFTVAVMPKFIENQEAVFEKLKELLPIEKDVFIKKTNKKEDPYEEISSKVSQEIADKISKMKIPGVALYREQWRTYPGGKLAAHALGFVGYDEDVLRGRYGLERYYDDFLERKKENLYGNFFVEILSEVRKATDSKPIAGDIVTSIEPSLEGYLEEVLSGMQDSFGSKKSGGIVMDPMTGRIVALALAPSFDPNEYSSEKDISVFQNVFVENVFEMGSILKPITFAVGIDAGVISATSTYFDSGSLSLNGKTIYNFDGKGRGRVSMQEVLNQSLNTGAAEVALRLGQQRFVEYFKKFGFGEETGIDLPGESAGLIKNLLTGRDIEIATASYGQGIALTPIQTLRALAALGNGGFLVTPHLVVGIDYKFAPLRYVDETEKIQIIKKETSSEITRMLVEVVDKALLDGSYKMKNYSIAAKTGTALIASPDGGYYKDKFLHTFFGYFPAYEPRFIIFLFTLEPQGVLYASHTLTKPFMNLAKFLINYYEIPPDR